MSLRIIHRFVGELPPEWQRWCSQLEDSLQRFQATVRDEFDRVDQQATRIYTETEVKTHQYRAQLWELVKVDTSGGNVTIVVPAPQPGNYGARIAVHKMTSPNTINVRAEDGSDITGLDPFPMGTQYYVLELISTSNGWQRN